MLKAKNENQKRILCYGDSLTWGYNPADGTRFAYHETWPGVMERSLGESYKVIVEALTARTTCWDLPYAPDRNGSKFLPMLLESHAPLDMVIIMLGINDLMHLSGKTADESAWGLLSLIRIAYTPLFGGTPPKILIIAPPVPGKMSDFSREGFGVAEEEIKKLPAAQKIVAETALCDFMDSNDFIKVDSVDGLHPMPDQYKILGEAVAERVRKIL
ncbi:MAG: SGNH/GDSL hydrolase family protein [Bacteroidetes bacterium]|nr:SGNH/GDSL hydrolase family protein [Bacteroidota bacterium]